MASIPQGRALLASQAFTIHDHHASEGTLITRTAWPGELAIDAGPVMRGTRLHADIVMFFAFRDGHIRLQEHVDRDATPEPPPLP
ncbi:MAG TPA: hypothetical protein PLX85_01005 [Dehalococcoidia bacterium]|nr:hypothetical protein [Dehalococcoidia bacterium]